MKESYTLADLKNWTAAKGEEEPIRFGIFGDPVAHSLSPEMQNAALQQSGIKMKYARFQIASNELQAALRLVTSLDFAGLNLTSPHKIPAAALMDELDERARQVGTVNTVRIENGKLAGFNTDGVGFSRAIRHEFSVDLRDLRILLFGCGGAGRAIATQCAIEGCERLVLVNRDGEKALELASGLKQFFTGARVSGPVARLEAVPWEERALRFQIANSDLIVNATSVGMKRADPPLLPASLLAPHLMVYDAVYTRTRAPLLVAAEEAGARSANGLSMLLEQGAQSFSIWFDRDAPREAMRAGLAKANP